MDLSEPPNLAHDSQIQLPSTRGHYTIYTPEQKAAIAKYAVEKGNLKLACDKFSEEYGIKVKESTARQFKKAYFDELNLGKRPEEIKALRGKRRGRPAKNRGNTPVKTLSTSFPGIIVTPDDVPIPISTDISTPVSEVSPNSFSSNAPISFTTDAPITTVTALSPEEMDEKVVGSEYAQMVGEMAISTCITVSA